MRITCLHFPCSYLVAVRVEPACAACELLHVCCLRTDHYIQPLCCDIHLLF
jgi:hypothetical protein